MRNRSHRPRWAGAAWLAAAVLAPALTVPSLRDASASEESSVALPVLPAAIAVGMRMDTVFVGGYARGTFPEAVSALGSRLDPQDQALLGNHLSRVFSAAGGLGDTGRLRVAFERELRPDGSTRAVRVLAAELARQGNLWTALYFDHDDRPGYFDPFGRPLASQGWTRPLRSTRVTSAFGRTRMHPILRRVLPHTGVDLGAPSGTPVYATGDGVVSFAGPRGGYGTTIEIRHADGLVTRYAHLSAISARATIGSLVSQGDVIGRVGMTGLATGPHLHYEVRRGGQPIDPLSMDSAPGAIDVAAEPGWATARRELIALLASTPSVAGS